MLIFHGGKLLIRDWLTEPTGIYPFANTPHMMQWVFLSSDLSSTLSRSWIILSAILVMRRKLKARLFWKYKMTDRVLAVLKFLLEDEQLNEKNVAKIFTVVPRLLVGLDATLRRSYILMLFHQGDDGTRILSGAIEAGLSSLEVLSDISAEKAIDSISTVKNVDYLILSTEWESTLRKHLSDFQEALDDALDSFDGIHALALFVKRTKAGNNRQYFFTEEEVDNLDNWLLYIPTLEELHKESDKLWAMLPASWKNTGNFVAIKFEGPFNLNAIFGVLIEYFQSDHEYIKISNLERIRQILTPDGKNIIRLDYMEW